MVCMAFYQVEVVKQWHGRLLCPNLCSTVSGRGPHNVVFFVCVPSLPCCYPVVPALPTPPHTPYHPPHHTRNTTPTDVAGLYYPTTAHLPAVYLPTHRCLYLRFPRLPRGILPPAACCYPRIAPPTRARLPAFSPATRTCQFLTYPCTTCTHTPPHRAPAYLRSVTRCTDMVTDGSEALAGGRRHRGALSVAKRKRNIGGNGNINRHQKAAKEAKASWRSGVMA